MVRWVYGVLVEKPQRQSDVWLFSSISALIRSSSTVLAIRNERKDSCPFLLLEGMHPSVSPLRMMVVVGVFVDVLYQAEKNLTCLLDAESWFCFHLLCFVLS